MSVGRVVKSDPLADRIAMSNGGTGPDELPKLTHMPLGFKQSSEEGNVSLPMPSYTTSQPFPPVISFTRAT